MSCGLKSSGLMSDWQIRGCDSRWEGGWARVWPRPEMRARTLSGYPKVWQLTEEGSGVEVVELHQ